MLTLGRESIKDHTTAVLELVKNSYDAGASVVQITLVTRVPKGGESIVIADNGHGMSEQDVENYWLRIGFSIKRSEKTTESRRRRVGEKGIGRISADRLGATLELRSQKLAEDAIGLRVNWDDFDKPGTDLEQIDIDVLESPNFKVPEPSKFDTNRNIYLGPRSRRIIRQTGRY